MVLEQQLTDLLQLIVMFHMFQIVKFTVFTSGKSGVEDLIQFRVTIECLTIEIVVSLKSLNILIAVQQTLQFR